MSILRFLSLTFAAAMLSVLFSCNQTPSVTTPNVAPSNVSSPVVVASKNRININNAILSELDKLEAKLGIPALSNQIQAQRPYGSPEELVSKKVINQAQYEQIKDMVTIEDIVLTGVAKDVDYMTKLGLMKGHLFVAKELLDLQKPAQAEPHIGHPVEEIYVDVEDQLNERNVPEFKTSLISLQDLVKAKSAKIDTNFTEAVKSVDNAIAFLPDAMRSSPEFVLQVINGLLDTANSEYTAAIANGKISAAIEYQDSRGFVIYAEELYKGISSQVSAASADTDKLIASNMSELSKNWPSVIPPATPVNPPAVVTQLIKTIEKESQKVLDSNTTTN
ncbi:ComEA family DNA-binding protein [Chlorogloea sp. CCALA 695]|uniref:ComEA family DNA-binding protein n=1 Tax=Chlorogloea sp. CCALA 695 TaxID=2107693 RepID=UPI000D07897F|nr:helix-hairpin-helix domain-containing protein [Chlorogloea sp. CCALA 695]PSB29687.1 DNA uptake protein [Chlorogloea sp. CCALA 695]